MNRCSFFSVAGKLPLDLQGFAFSKRVPSKNFLKKGSAAEHDPRSLVPPKADELTIAELNKGEAFLRLLLCCTARSLTTRSEGKQRNDLDKDEKNRGPSQLLFTGYHQRNDDGLAEYFRSICYPPHLSLIHI